MRRLLSAILFLLAPLVLQANIFSDCSCFTPCVGAEWLYLKPTITDLNYARVLEVTEVTGPSAHGDIMVGKLKAIQPDFDSGFRVWGGVCHQCGWDARVSYRRFEARDRASVNTPEPDPQFNESIQVLMAVGFVTDIDHNRFRCADSHVRYCYDKVDIDLGWSWCCCPVRFHLFGGLGYLGLDEKFAVEYDKVLDPGIVGFTSVENRSRINCWGPRLGFDANWNVRCGFSLNAQIATDLLVARHRGGISETGLDDQTGELTFDLQWDEDFTRTLRIVPALDLRFGIRYTRPFNCFCIAIEGGYQVLHYFNAIDQIKIAGNDQGDDQNTSLRMEHSTIWQSTSDFGLHGFYLGGTVCF